MKSMTPGRCNGLTRPHNQLMDEFVQKPVLFPPQNSIPSLKLHIKYKYRIMAYHGLQITLAHALKILGVGLTEGIA